MTALACSRPCPYRGRMAHRYSGLGVAFVVEVTHVLRCTLPDDDRQFAALSVLLRLH